MIPNIVRGTRVGGLIRYLYGPGRREEHANPHLIAAWDGAGPLSTLEPIEGTIGKRDFRILTDLLEQSVRSGFNPPDKPVWHCSIRTHPSDRWLTNAQWAHIAAEVMAATDLAPHGDPAGVRWVAIRHGPDHIHLVATLVRQDRRTAWARNDRWLAQAACRDLEQRYGLHRVGPADHTGHRYPSAAEVNKARRTGRAQTIREQLRREVRYAAATAGDQAEFFSLLHAAGLLVRTRVSSTNPDQITGYAVALPNDTTGAGRPVWYGGGKLAPDLTLPQLRSRWHEPDPAHGMQSVQEQAAVYDQAAAQVHAAAQQVSIGDPATASAVARAAADLLTAAARAVESDRYGPLHQAAEALDGATRSPYRRPLPHTHHTNRLRATARLVRLAGQISGDKTITALRRLIVNLALLADAVAELRDAEQRLRQARTARTAARLLRTTATPTSRPGGHDSKPAVTPPATVAATGSPTRYGDPRRQARPTTTGPTR